MKQYIAFYTDHHSSDVGRQGGGSLSRSRYPHHCTLLCCLPNTRQRKKLFSSRYFDLCFLLSFSEIVPHTSQHLHNSHYTWHSRHRGALGALGGQLHTIGKILLFPAFWSLTDIFLWSIITRVECCSISRVTGCARENRAMLQVKQITLTQHLAIISTCAGP